MTVKRRVLNAFGESIQTSTGSTFTGIVEVLPFLLNLRVDLSKV